MLKCKGKKIFLDLFNKKISLYSDITDEISFEVEQDGINYLVYPADGENTSLLKGYIYNISFFELKKLFNVTGTHLFDKNVRSGRVKKSIGDELKIRFQEYLRIALYNIIINHKPTTQLLDKIKDILLIDEETLSREDVSLPENFWFHHNGISIFCNDEVNNYGNKIIFNPKKVSVINGAQTLTNFFDSVEEVEREFINEIKKIEEFSIALSIESVLKSIIVKTIIIQGENKFVTPITRGLNTQIPILDETILAGSETVKKINSQFNEKIKILREGEYHYGGRGYNLIEFIKNWMTIHGEPGKSKNLVKINLEVKLEEISNIIEDSNYKIKAIKSFEILDEVYEWWSTSKKERDKSANKNDSSKAISSYGRNYFCSFVLKNISDNQIVDEATLISLYEIFEKELIVIKDGKITLDDFKKDDLSKKMLEKRVEYKSSIEFLSENVKTELISILNSVDQNTYTFSKRISHYFNSTINTIPYFKVITLYDRKCKEAFPFHNSTFSEICDTEPSLQYDESLFSKEVNKEFPVFIIYKSSNANSIINIDFIRNFSFREYDIDAKNVYDKTIEAFREGDEYRFVKSHDNLRFHVSPKAVNSNDTFEFTNGKFITKRTFWANKDTVQSLVEKYANIKS